MVLIVLLDKTNETCSKKKPSMKVETSKLSIKPAKDKITQQKLL
ncbi:4992_t:CDS:1, partial [Racocetra fulgida]